MEGRGKDTEEGNRTKMYYVLKNSIMKPTEDCIKKGGENGNLMEAMNLFKVYSTHIWNYHNETPM